MTIPCINCGQPMPAPRTPSRFNLCRDCRRAERELANLLRTGIKLEYRDGATETLTLTHDPKDTQS